MAPFLPRAQLVANIVDDGILRANEAVKPERVLHAGFTSSCQSGLPNVSGAIENVKYRLLISANVPSRNIAPIA